MAVNIWRLAIYGLLASALHILSTTASDNGRTLEQRGTSPSTPGAVIFRRVTCNSQEISCPDFNVCCLPNYSCCSASQCCSPGTQQCVNGVCVAGTVVTSFVTVTSYFTSFAYSTAFVTSASTVFTTSTTLVTVTVTSNAAVATSTLLSTATRTVTQVAKRTAHRFHAAVREPMVTAGLSRYAFVGNDFSLRDIFPGRLQERAVSTLFVTVVFTATTTKTNVFTSTVGGFVTSAVRVTNTVTSTVGATSTVIVTSTITVTSTVTSVSSRPATTATTTSAVTTTTALTSSTPTTSFTAPSASTTRFSSTVSSTSAPQSSTTPAPTSTDTGNSGLSQGAIIGIGVGAGLGGLSLLGLIAFLIWFCVMRKKRDQDNAIRESTATTLAGMPEGGGHTSYPPAGYYNGEKVVAPSTVAASTPSNDQHETAAQPWRPTSMSPPPPSSLSAGSPVQGNTPVYSSGGYPPAPVRESYSPQGPGMGQGYPPQQGYGQQPADRQQQGNPQQQNYGHASELGSQRAAYYADPQEMYNPPATGELAAQQHEYHAYRPGHEGPHRPELG